MPKWPPNIQLRGHEDYLQYVQMRATLRSLLRLAESDPYNDISVVVAELIEKECPFVVETEP